MPPTGTSGNRSVGSGLAGRQAGIWSIVAVVALTLATAASAFTVISNADIFWHLASGRWMLEHGRVLGVDPFSIEPEPEWVNVHWLFQVVVALLHSVGGFEALTVLKTSLGAVTMLIFALALRRNVPAGWLIFSGLAMLVIMIGRVRVRPEIFSLTFIMLTVVLLEGVRRGASPKRLWWLVPITLAWANMHGLYILGLGMAWSSVIGAWVDRRMGRSHLVGNLATVGGLGPVLTATVAILVTPWPVEAALHPFLLWTRISGQAFYYTYGVSELRPTYEVLRSHWDAIVPVLLTVAVMILNWRRVPVCQAIWLVAFVGLGLLARRNVGLLGPVVGYLLAWHGALLLGRIKTRWAALRLARPLLAAAMALSAVALALASATSATWRYLNSDHRFGAGLQEENYPLATARFLRELRAEGDLLCENFGDAGPFIYYSYPKHKLYMDGRLEAHSVQRFRDLYRISNDLRTAGSADKVQLPDRVRFIFVRHNASEKLGALAKSTRFQLVYLDGAGACFARRDWYLGGPPLPEPNFSDFDRPVGQDGMVAGFPAARRRWYVQNPQSDNFRIGQMMLSLGQEPGRNRPREISSVQERCMLLAVRFLSAARSEGVLSQDVLNGTLAQAHQRRALQYDVVPSEHVPLDIHSALALALYRQTDLTKLDDPTIRMFALDHIVAALQARQIDAAAKAVKTFMANLPPRQQVQPPQEYLELRDIILHAMDESVVAKSRLDEQRLPVLERTYRLTSPQIGLTLDATAELQVKAQPNSKELCLLGDLFLRQGRLPEARQTYANISPDDADAWQLGLRDALGDWGEGNWPRAVETFSKLAADSQAPAIRYYQALLLEELGWYGQAKAAVSQASSTDANLQQLIGRIRQRLQAR